MQVKRAGVVGAGTMGAAIAEVLAFNGIDVVLKDLDDALVEKGLGRVRQYVDELVRFNSERAGKEIARIQELGVNLAPEQSAAVQAKLAPKFSRQRGDEVVGRVHGTTTYEPFASVDFVVEAAFEKMEIKRQVFESLDAVLPEYAILGSNTSSLSITRLARGLRHTPQILVTHFFNPPVTLPLVEVAGGVDTREDVITDTLDFLQGLRNHRYPLVPIRVKESPGFVVNRLLIPVLAEACFALQEGLGGA
ncbi:MAG: 3-hydroxyacyl-CoA dehydrogenase family protein, partial [Thermoplasmata archaeon]